MRKVWTANEIDYVRRSYPDMQTTAIAKRLDRGVRSVTNMASKLGVKKSGAYMNDVKTRTCFKPDMTPWNKGVKGRTGMHPNCRRNQFQKGVISGRAAEHMRSIGAVRITKDGYLIKKVKTNGSRSERWKPVHRIVWEKAYGAVPENHFIVFKKGMKTTDERLITADRLELVNRAELMRKNSPHHNYPKEVCSLIQLRGALNRKINRLSKGVSK